jgi:hypothetical protein
MKYQHQLRVSLFLAMACSASRALADPVSLIPSAPSSLETYGGQLSAGLEYQTTYFTALPVSNFTDNAPDASTTYNFTTSDFDVSMSHFHGGVFGEEGGSEGTLRFTATEPGVLYAMTGEYGFSLPYASLEVVLTDVSSHTTVFHYEYVSDYTGASGSTFVLGQRGPGINAVFSTGPLTGTLSQNNEYDLAYNAFSETTQAGAAGQGSGDLNLAFTETALPECGFGPLVLLGALGFSTRRFCRNR